MGLDTTHDAWHGSYGAFSVWRKDIAVAAGIIGPDDSLYPRSSYDVKRGVKDSPIDWLFWDTQTDYYGKWKKDPEDVIWVLLAHSDCEGHIKKRFLRPLADRLEALVPQVDGQDWQYTDYMSTRTQRFVNGLRLAAADGQKLRFH
jgi:hypothetical protein